MGHFRALTAYDLDKLKHKYRTKDNIIDVDGLQLTYDDKGRVSVEASNYSEWLSKQPKENDVGENVQRQRCDADISEPRYRGKGSGKKIADYYRKRASDKNRK